MQRRPRQVYRILGMKKGVVSGYFLGEDVHGGDGIVSGSVSGWL